MCLVEGLRYTSRVYFTSQSDRDSVRLELASVRDSQRACHRTCAEGNADIPIQAGQKTSQLLDLKDLPNKMQCLSISPLATP